MVKNGYTQEFAERTFSQLEGFGSYGFLRRQVDDILGAITKLPRVSTGTSRKFRAYCRAEKRSVGDVAVAILNGEIRVRRIDGRTGFRGIHVALDGGYRTGRRDQSVISDCEEHSE